MMSEIPVTITIKGNLDAVRRARRLMELVRACGFVFQMLNRAARDHRSGIERHCAALSGMAGDLYGHRHQPDSREVTPNS